MISDKTIEDVLLATDLVALVREYAPDLQKRVHEEFRIEERDGTICITHCGRPIDTFCDNDCVDDLLSSIGKYRSTAVTYKHQQ